MIWPSERLQLEGFLNYGLVRFRESRTGIKFYFKVSSIIDTPLQSDLWIPVHFRPNFRWKKISKILYQLKRIALIFQADFWGSFYLGLHFMCKNRENALFSFQIQFVLKDATLKKAFGLFLIFRSIRSLQN